jgi:putative protease
VVRVYREALDALASQAADAATAGREWMQEIEKAGSRGYTTGFYSGHLADDSQEYETVRTLPEWEYAGLVKGWNALDGMALVEQRNHMQLGDEIEVLRPAGSVTRQRLSLMTDVEGSPLTTAPHPQQMLLVQLDAPADEFAMLRRRRRE